MKYDYTVEEISHDKALEMIRKYHYSDTLPKINKHFVGFYLNDELVGVVTLGYGTQPRNTIKKIFPSLDTKDYFEIGRMCMTEDMPKNSESQMISHLIKWIKKNCPEVKILFTWADGMMGKVGYVYQSCSFLYAGFYLTDTYLKDGIKIHPRKMKALIAHDEDDKRITIRPSIKQMEELGISHIKGKQYKYLTFLCNKAEKHRLIKESLVPLNMNYPKEDDLIWYIQKNKGVWEECGKPYFKTDLYKDSDNSDNEPVQLELF